MQQKSIALKASAGSGKTFTLALAYLKLVLGNANPNYFRHICCLTFTNKAAQEMRDRILHALQAIGELSPSQESDFLPLLQTELQLEEKVLRKRAKMVALAILKNYSDFAVSTIDKFMIRISQAFANELQLPAGAEVAVDTELIIADEVEALMAEVEENNPLKKLLLSWMNKQLDNGKNLRVENLLNNFARQQFTEDTLAVMPLLKQQQFEAVANAQKAFSKQINAINEQLTHEFETLKRIVEPNSLETFGSRGTFGRHVVGFLNSKALDYERWNKWLSEDEIQLSKDQESKQYKDLLPALKSFAVERFPVLNRLIQTRLLFEIVSKQLEESALLTKLIAIGSSQMNTFNRVHLSLFNHKVNEVVRQESAPFIYERLGEFYHHYLLDEFQDTSVLQWENLIPLLEQSLANGYFNLIVGDAKQAIYRFRSGNAEQFVKLPSLYLQEEKDWLKAKNALFESGFQVDELLYNYRSAENIVHFNNVLFQKMATAYLSETERKAYQGQPAVAKRYAGKGSVWFRMYPSTASAEYQEDDEEELGEKHQVPLQALMEYIKDALALGYRYDEMAVLALSKGELAVVANTFNQHDIPFVSPETLGVFSSDKVRFVYAILQFYFSKPNSVNGAEALYLLGFLRPNVQAFHDLSDRFKTLNYQLDKVFAELDLNLPKPAKGETAYDYAIRLQKQFDFLNWDEYLDAFFELLLQQVVQPRVAFEDWVNTVKLKGEDAYNINKSATNAIQLMTIHQSKGLEFELVMVMRLSTKNHATTKNGFWWEAKEAHPDLKSIYIAHSSKLNQSQHFAEIQTLEEERTATDLANKWYVAFTRPQHHLCIIGYGKSSKNKESKYIDLPAILSMISELGTVDEEEGYTDFKMGQFEFLGQKSRQEHAQAEAPTIENPYPIANSNIVFAPTTKIAATDEVALGIALHKVLSLVHAANDINEIVQWVSTQMGLKAEVLKALNEQLGNLRAHREIWELLTTKQGEHLNEQTFATASGQLLRPDKVIHYGQNALVVDFKTGAPQNEHLAQVLEYVSTVRDALGVSCRGALLYSQSAQLVWVDE